MNINMIEQENLGKAYLVAWGFMIIGLFLNSVFYGALGVILMIVTFLSDNNPANHEDPPGTKYMDRNGKPVGGPEQESIP